MCDLVVVGRAAWPATVDLVEQQHVLLRLLRTGALLVVLMLPLWCCGCCYGINRCAQSPIMIHLCV